MSGIATIYRSDPQSVSADEIIWMEKGPAASICQFPRCKHPRIKHGVHQNGVCRAASCPCTCFSPVWEIVKVPSPK